MEAVSAPVLSTPAEHLLELPPPVIPRPSASRLSEEEFDRQYEIERTANAIRDSKWERVALQFPDDMLVDGPRVYERLVDRLGAMHARSSTLKPISPPDARVGHADATDDQSLDNAIAPDVKLTILGDTSYGACCVDEVAAEHVDAEAVVHYGRACLSPTARLPVLYVYTSMPLDLDRATEYFIHTYESKDEKVIIVADVPYSHHVTPLAEKLQALGYGNVYPTDVVRDPSSPLPNRSLPEALREDTEGLREYSIFHISSPPTSLLLILSSRVRSVHVFKPSSEDEGEDTILATQLLRRRYALVTRLSTASVFGILINTLSVANYMTAMQHVQEIIKRAGKKSYTFVVGKVNAAKVANFAEVEGWVVIGCWESSLIESKDFWRPIVTPFELEVALAGDETRTWGGEWIGDFSSLLPRQQPDAVTHTDEGLETDQNDSKASAAVPWDEMSSDDEPPEFDLRTGRYVSHTRPLGRAKAATNKNLEASGQNGSQPGSALVHRVKGDIATIGGAVSPAAEFLRSKRTWQGLGSDYEVAYERDEDGKIRGAPMEEGRTGTARGYTVGDDATKG